MSELPTATLKSTGIVAYLRELGRPFVHGTAIALAASVCLGLSIGASRVGCRNDAITYAKAIWPEAHCDAVTTFSGCNDHGKDVAVCRVGDRRILCKVGFGTWDSDAACSELGR